MITEYPYALNHGDLCNRYKETTQIATDQYKYNAGVMYENLY